MGSQAETKKPHAVCIPFPAQGHINPMLKLATLLYHNGFCITFVNSEYNHKRILKSRGPNSLDGFPDFVFKTIPDGLPPTDPDSIQDIASLCYSTQHNCFEPFCDLVVKLNDSSKTSDVPPVACIISDGCMSFTLRAAEKFGIPGVLFWPMSACGFYGFTQYRNLVERGFTPIKDASCLTNGYLDTVMDWIPGMKNIRLKDLPSFVRTTDSKDILFNFLMEEAESASKASAVILNTFDALEQDVLDALSAMLRRVYTIGPIPLLIDQICDDKLKSIGLNLWKEEDGCIEWLNSKEPNSVVYVNFGSFTVMTPNQLIEFAWGIANSKKSFLWIIRPGLVVEGDSTMLLREFVTKTEKRGMLASWCPQEQVLNHPSVGGFITHSGWNSTLESLCGGVPVICWPFFGDQQTNCRYSCTEWGIGMEINNDVKRGEVEELVRELMDGERGNEMKKRALEWKKKAEEAITPGGSSYLNLARLVGEELLSKYMAKLAIIEI